MNEIIKKTPFWIFTSTILLIALLLVVSSKGVTIGDGLSVKKGQEAAEKTVDYINDVLLQGTDSVELVSVSEESGVYKLEIAFMDDEIKSYVTRDGKLFFPEAFNMDEPLPGLNNDEMMIEQEEIIDIDIDEEEMGDLIDCLKDKKFVIYGADWCPFCKEVVDLFGGHEKVGLIYVECTENETLCREKNITGYPTIQIDGNEYQGMRNIRGFVSETGC